MNTGGIIRIITEAGLSLPPVFQRETPEELARHYNGVGADWFPAWLRKLATKVLVRMEPLAFVHDVEFATSAPNYFAFSIAQVRWAYNALLLVLLVYRRYRLRFLAVAWLCALACQLGGYKGYLRGLRK